MRIAFVIGTLGLGGTESQVCRLAAELSARGDVVKLFVTTAGGPLEARLIDDDTSYEIFGFAAPWFRAETGRATLQPTIMALRAIWRLERKISKFEPDVCHAFLPWAYMLGMPLSALARVPVRVAGRRSLSSKLALPRRLHWLHRLSTSCADAIVANSAAVEADVLAHERPRPRHTYVIPNGVDSPAEATNVTGLGRRIVVVANLIVYKGHADLFRALALLPKGLEVRLFGDGPERERLETLACDLGVRGQVVFEGAVPDASRFFADAQIAVLPSHHEGAPNAVLEALAAGVPIVATRVGGIPELLDDGVEGFLVPPRDPHALAAALGRLLCDEGLRVRMGEAGRQRGQMFGWDKCTEGHRTLYGILLAEKRRRPRISPRSRSRS